VSDETQQSIAFPLVQDVQYFVAHGSNQSHSDDTREPNRQAALHHRFTLADRS
jgi:hypothetical protein